MIIRSLRFGSLEIPEDKIIHMERPILGFEGLTSFCLIEMEELAPFYWFQSTENQAVAFLVFNPAILYPDYRIEINSQEIAELEVSEVSAVETYVVVTIPEDPREMSANLQGPILINNENNRAKQLVLVNSDYKVKHFMIEATEHFQQEASKSEQLVGV
ncbi:MAG: flagellar assembly protein FliW [Candidatus Zixiibacteriota bacterium]|nr:MAG: flagellar assembly protein FliW [candidate division Zixibacteria bacterium]